jgi:glucose-1-phosphate thymidylyltransferase
MKGIILSGGYGTRLYPATKAICKQLLPVFDKPMIYYPLSVLMLASIRDILIISTPEDIGRFEALFGTGEDLGLKIKYKLQERPNGLAEAFILAEDFIEENSVCLILGDNIFYGSNFSNILQGCTCLEEGAIIFGYHVNDPALYGVVEFDHNFKPLSIEEKPLNPKSNYAVAGLYFYDNSVIEVAKALKPSKRNELEITDINRSFLERGSLEIKLLGRGYAWLDTGTFDALQKASIFVQTIQERQGIKIACIEEIAYRKGFIDLQQLCLLANRYNNEYGLYLSRVIKEVALEKKAQKFSSTFVFS